MTGNPIRWDIREVHMRCRFSPSALIGAFSIAVVLISPDFVAAQTPKAPAKSATRTWTAPRTPDGQPSFEGYWTNTTYTPLQRPNNVTKEFFTQDELREFVKKAATD